METRVDGTGPRPGPRPPTPRTPWRRVGGILALALGAVAITATAGSGYHDGGNPKNGLTGCGGSGCHASEARSVIVTRLDAVPAAAESGKTYTLHATVDGPQYPKPRPEGQYRAGYAVDVDVGRLEPVDGLSRMADTTVTQTADGARKMAWDFRWVAPASGASATFHVTAMIAENSSVSQLDDLWNTEVLLVPLAPHKGLPAPGGLAALAAAAVPALLRRGGAA